MLERLYEVFELICPKGESMCGRDELILKECLISGNRKECETTLHNKGEHGKSYVILEVITTMYGEY